MTAPPQGNDYPDPAVSRAAPAEVYAAVGLLCSYEVGRNGKALSKTDDYLRGLNSFARTVGKRLRVRGKDGALVPLLAKWPAAKPMRA